MRGKGGCVDIEEALEIKQSKIYINYKNSGVLQAREKKL